MTQTIRRKNCKTRREWAEQIVEKARLHYNDGEPSPFINVDQARQLLRKEHARAVRIVRQAKALQLHGLRDTDTNEFLEGYEAACVDILAALSKGRA
jgi:hypothetical protein